MVTKSVSKNTNIRGGLSKKESFLLSSLSEKEKNLLTIDDIMKELDCSYTYAKVIASRLVKKKWLEYIEKGKYLIIPLEAGTESIYTQHEFVIASQLIDPYYIGYRSALNYYGLTEQIPFSVFIATTKRKSKRKILDVNYVFVTLTKKKFFGYDTINIAGKNICISDREKTIADCLDHPEYCGGIAETAKALWNAKEKIDFEKLIDYASKMNNSAIFKRLGYLAGKMGMRLSKELNKKIETNLSKGYAVLDTTRKRKGKYDSKRRLLINISDNDLLEWMVIH